MKNLLIMIVILALPLMGHTQESKQIDSAAVFILDKMSDVIGGLESVRFTLHTTTDQLNEYNIVTTNDGVSTVNMVGPNKLAAQTSGDNGNKGYWYDGELVTYYSFDENNYVTLEAPDNIIDMMDGMHEAYDFQFPAADFFYPSFTDDIMEAFDSISFLGEKTINGKVCYHIMAVNKTTTVQLWVSSDLLSLPMRLIVIQKNSNHARYEATFSDWELNPIIPEAVFEFAPPPNSRLISVLSKS